jgi:hypothetical protein
VFFFTILLAGFGEREIKPRGHLSKSLQFTPGIFFHPGVIKCGREVLSWDWYTVRTSIRRRHQIEAIYLHPASEFFVLNRRKTVAKNYNILFKKVAKNKMAGNVAFNPMIWFNPECKLLLTIG